MDKLLNFAEPLDINLLDRVVGAVYGENDQERNMAQVLLTQLKEHPQSWTRVDTILEHSSNNLTRFYALQILDDLIKYRWKILPPDQRSGIKNYVISLVLKLSTTEELLVSNRLILDKLNLNLVQILKHDWPSNWQTFVPEITTASKTNECICENNMKILLTLSEEVFDFSKGEMTQAKISQLKESLNNEFFLIFQLCEFIMANSQKTRLLTVTLETLLRYLGWIPLGYIFATTLVQTLIMKFLAVPTFRNLTTQCLTEIAQVQIGGQHADVFAQIFTMFMGQLYQIIPPSTNIAQAYASGRESDQNFIQNLAIFLGQFLANHRKDVEKDELIKLVTDAHYYLVQLSLVEDVEVFRICLEYWTSLAGDLYNEAPAQTTVSPLMLNDTPVVTPRRQLYAPILSRVRDVVISRMAKPEEVIVVDDGYGNIVRETRKDGEQVTRYKSMRSVLVFLTHLDYEDTQRIMMTKLQSQVGPSSFNWTVLNTLCWAIGSIAGTQTETREKRFLVLVIKDLLTLCEMKRGKDNKAVVASNIMYIVGQYPRFLRAHWKFLSTVINKLFEFMHESHPGVQDMSCDTFLKIVKKCKGKFATVQEGETEPFTLTVIQAIPAIISDLNDSQIQTFYEAVGHMVSGHQPHEMEHTVGKLMELPNNMWFEIMNHATKNPECLKSPEVIKKLADVLKTNVRACSAVGHGFIHQIGRIYIDLLRVCNFYSSEISKAVIQIGPQATTHAIVKEMRIVKRETLNLITTFIRVSTDSAPIVQNFLPPLLPSVLEDYKQSVPIARDAEVLALMANIVGKCGHSVTNEIPAMFNAVFEVTLEMISTNFEDFPEIRIEFYNFLREVNRHCFSALKRMGGEVFKLIIHSIIIAFKNKMRNISEIGLNITQELLQQINTDTSEVANSFYQTYFLHLLTDVFHVLTDTFHKSGFKLQAAILLQMFVMVETQRVTVPIFDVSKHEPGMDNRRFLREYVMRLLVQSFPNLTQQTCHTFVVGLFDLHRDFPTFCKHLRDFLVQLKEFAGGDDNSQLYASETEAELQQAQQKEMQIPGLVGANDPRRDSEILQ